MSSQPPVLYAADLEQVASTIATAVTQLVRESLDVQAAPGQLVDVNEMARRSGVSSSTLERRVKGGSVPSIKIGSRRLFDPDAVFAALNGDQSKPASEQPTSQQTSQVEAADAEPLQDGQPLETRLQGDDVTCDVCGDAMTPAPIIRGYRNWDCPTCGSVRPLKVGDSTPEQAIPST